MQHGLKISFWVFLIRVLWWTIAGSNRSPHPCHGCALPNELMALFFFWSFCVDFSSITKKLHNCEVFNFSIQIFLFCTHLLFFDLNRKNLNRLF